MTGRILFALIAAFAFLFAFAAPAAAQAEVFEQGYEAARADYIVGLVELTEWCKENKLFASRVELADEVLGLDPDNEAAREALGHKRQRDGSWKEPKSRRAAKDHDKEAKAELAEKREAVLDGFCARCIALLDEQGETVPSERRERLKAELVVMAPDNLRVRKLSGETRVEGAWVLEETVAAKARRPKLREMVRKAFAESTAPATVKPDEREAGLGIAWTKVVDAQVARVLGTGRPEEVETFGRVLQVALAYFNELFGEDAKYYRGATIFLLANKGEREVFLDKHPKVDAKYRKFLLTLEGSGIDQSSDLAYWADDERLRIDGSTRIALSWLFLGTYKITPEHGWIWEGFGLYLTRELIGTRLTWFAQPSELSSVEEDRALRARLLDPKTNWMDEANKILSSDRSPSLVFVLGKGVNSMTPEDLLLAYVVAAYLLEAHPEKASELLQRVGNGTLSAVAIEQLFGMDVHAFDKRVRRWLTERK